NAAARPAASDVPPPTIKLPAPPRPQTPAASANSVPPPPAGPIPPPPAPVKQVGSLLQATPVAPRPGTSSKTADQSKNATASRPGAPANDEAAPWDKLPSETDDPSARADTPRSGRRAQTLEAEKNRRRLYLIMAAVGGGVLLVIGVILWLVLRNGDKEQEPDKDRTTEISKGPVVRYVGPGERYKSVREALAQHRAGDATLV